MKKEIKGYECKFVTHGHKIEGERPDIHVIKEIIHYTDGTTEPNLKIVENYEKPFWVTKPIYQKYKQKKEEEPIDRLNMFKSTESDIVTNAKSRLGYKYQTAKSYRDLTTSPYLYGTDINSRTFIKKAYMNKYPDCKSDYQVAALDIEVNTLTNEIIVLTVAKRDYCYVTILDKLIDKIDNPMTKLKEIADKYLPKHEITENLYINYDVFDNEVDMIKAAINKVHSWKPDFLAIWNISYDLDNILRVLEENGIDPKHIFSDPSIPIPYRYFKFKKGSTSTKTAGGKLKPKSPHEQWHSVNTPASFYMIDSMSAHHFIRVGDKVVNGGYSLDNILSKTLGDKLGKLNFEGDDGNHNIDWHKMMVKDKPLEYIIYNVWDVMSMLALDDHTLDLKTSLPVFAEASPFDVFNSNPTKTVNAMFFIGLENNIVLGTFDRVTKKEEELLGRDDWIIQLQPERIKDNGLRLLKESKRISTNIRGSVFDVDQTQGYPMNGIISNLSKTTTSKELISIEGVTREEVMVNNINLVMGCTNHNSYCETMFKFPSAFEILEKIKDIDIVIPA